MEKRYIQTFETSESLQEALDNNELGKPYVAYLEDEQRIDWNEKEKAPDYSLLPLTFEIISGGTINLKANNGDKTVVLEYQKNDGEWIPFTSSTAGYDILVEAGDKVRFIGNNDAMAGPPPLFGDDKTNQFKDSTATYNIYGNIMSILSKTGYTEMTAITTDLCFAHLFQDCLGLVSARNLVLPALTLSKSCYKCMFQGSTNLVYGPKVLPATTLAYWCCLQMFRNCTSLVAGPDLLASNLDAERVYSNLYGNCTSLNYVKCLATSFTGNNCTQGWLYNVSSTGTFVKHPNATWESGISGIPTGWTVQDATI